jgi:hypothetical protein
MRRSDREKVSRTRAQWCSIREGADLTGDKLVGEPWHITAHMHRAGTHSSDRCSSKTVSLVASAMLRRVHSMHAHTPGGGGDAQLLDELD